MKKMSKKERREYIDKLKKKRADIQNEIQALKKKRDRYVSEQRKKMAGEKTLDTAVIDAIRDQARKKNFEFEKK